MTEPTPAVSRPLSERKPIYCDCCGTVILAEQVEGTIVIKAKRNGKLHVAVIFAGMRGMLTLFCALWIPAFAGMTGWMRE